MPDARVDVLTSGYAEERVASSVSLVRDGAAVIVVDPGMVADRSAILDPLHALGVSPEQVTDVVISHHHPDHTINIALFPEARVHDFATTYWRDSWIDREPGEFELSPGVRLVPTPGHTDQDLTTVVRTADGIVALTHVWWMAQGPVDDPFARDGELLRASRRLVLDLAPHLVIPGHGVPFVPDATTPL
jgi:glyoxylase-like metal-dependent hydrolase (beta-lactamase superfamily II)